MSNGTDGNKINVTAQFEIERTAFINKLTAADESLTKIFETDSDKLVLGEGLCMFKNDSGEFVLCTAPDDGRKKSFKVREKLKELQEASKKIRDKLEKREFTVAIVGLEKSGKSSLGNALIELMALPEYRERCTYTTTEIRASETNDGSAEVHFYTYEEFNETFRQMLGAVEYPNAANVDFDKMELPAFNSHWQRVMNNNPVLYNAYDKNIAQDIRIILQNKTTITDLLGKDKKPFEESFLNDSNIVNTFKQFITGIVRIDREERYENVNGQRRKVVINTAVRDAHPYAVKKVIIRSAQFAAMEDIILYDVPGFNSPTKMHQEQTEKMLKEADAIIFVTNVAENPNLEQAQLSTLSNEKNKDTYGVELKNKSFVFGNKIDRANSKQEAIDNLGTLRRESYNRSIAREGYVIGGSARAYLESVGLIHIPPPDPDNPDDESTKSSKETLDSWQFSYGVKELRDKIQEYYDVDRFKVLKANAEKILNDTRLILQALLKQYDRPDSALGEHDKFVMEIGMEKQGRLPKFIEAARSLTNEHIAKIFSERPFTKALKDELSNIYPLSATEDIKKIIADVEYKPKMNLSGIYQIIRIDERVRERIGVLFLKNIVTSAAKFTNEKQQELRNKLVDKFLEIMGNEAEPTYETALRQSVNKFFDDMLIKDCAECNFHSLVERFVMTLIDALIMQPFASEERFQYVKKALRELVSLSVYYNMPSDEAEEKSLQFESLIYNGDTFFARILAHEDLPVAETIEEETVDDSNETFLRNFFIANVKDINKGSYPLDIASLKFNEWASSIRINDRKNVTGELRNLFNADNWGSFLVNKKLQSIEQIFEAYKRRNANSPPDVLPIVTSEHGKKASTLLTSLSVIKKHAESKRMSSKDDMIRLLDEDIKILRDITEKSVLNAIGLERAFNSIVTKNVELICTQLEDVEENGHWKEWATNNMEKLVPSRFKDIIAKSQLREQRRTIVASIKKLLTN